MKKLFLCLILLVFALGTNGQNDGFINEGDLNIKTKGAFLKLHGENIKNAKAFLEQNGVKGSPYMMEEFVDGYVVTNNNFKYVDIPLRYNIYNDNIEFQRDDEILAFNNPSDYRVIAIGNHIFIYSEYASSNSNKSTYFEVLNNNKKLLLLKRYGMELINPVASKGYVEAKPAEFKQNPVRYYLKVDGMPAQEIGNLNTTFLLFGDKKSAIEDLIKMEKLKLRKQSDLLRIVDFYNAM